MKTWTPTWAVVLHLYHNDKTISDRSYGVRTPGMAEVASSFAQPASTDMQFVPLGPACH